MDTGCIIGFSSLSSSVINAGLRVISCLCFVPSHSSLLLCAQVKNAIEFLMAQQAELPDTGDSVPQVKQRLKDLEHFDGMAQVS